MMLRSLLPTTLALLLAPSFAFAAPELPVGGETSGEARAAGPLAARAAPDRARASPDRADRSKKKSSGKRSGSKSGGDGGEKSEGGGDKGGGDSRAPRPAPAPAPAPRDGGSDGGDSRSPRPAPRDSGAEGSRDTESSREADGSARRPAPVRPSPADGDRAPDGTYARPDARPAPGAEPGRPMDGARPAPGAEPGRPMDGARPAPGAEPGRPGMDAARPAPGAEPGRPGMDGARPAPTVRKVSVGAPTRAGTPTSLGSPANLAGRQPDGPGVAARPAPSNLRTPATANFRGARDERVPASRESHASAERHGGRGSDAERVTHGSHAGSERHREEVRHARATAAYHRSSAHYRRSAAARHHAWATARHHRYNRWYHPGGWFRPYRPGHAYWYHGVFVYGPSPWYHHHHTVIVDGGGDGGGGAQERAQAEPVRKVDRNRTFAVGIRGGSYLGGYNFGGGGFGDAGLGLAVRYRPVEAVGLELSWMHHDQTWDDGSERINQPLQASVQLFGMPWTKVNPYVLAGVTVTGRDVQDNVGFTTVNQSSTLFGPHAGLGIEFGLGQKASVNFDARYTGYLNKPENDITVPGAFQGNMGLNFYF